MGINIGYHRLISHRSFETYKWLEYTLGLIGCITMIGSPLAWTAIHRQHHAYSDTDKDPQSPTHYGFWRIYFNLWGLEQKIERKFFKGLINNKILKFWHDHYFKMVGVLVVTLFAIDPLLLVFAYALPCVLSSHLFGLFNAYLHKTGEATNNILINGSFNYDNIISAIYLNGFYLATSIYVFYYSFDKAREKGTLINMGE